MTRSIKCFCISLSPTEPAWGSGREGGNERMIYTQRFNAVRFRKPTSCETQDSEKKKILRIIHKRRIKEEISTYQNKNNENAFLNLYNKLGYHPKKNEKNAWRLGGEIADWCVPSLFFPTPGHLGVWFVWRGFSKGESISGVTNVECGRLWSPVTAKVTLRGRTGVKRNWYRASAVTLRVPPSSDWWSGSLQEHSTVYFQLGSLYRHWYPMNVRSGTYNVQSTDKLLDHPPTGFVQQTGVEWSCWRQIAHRDAEEGHQNALKTGCAGASLQSACTCSFWRSNSMHCI